MLFCDIGNSSYHFEDDGISYKKDVKDFNPKSITKKVYFISVNEKVDTLLQDLDNWINLALYIDKKDYYETMGIDRIVAVKAVSDGIIIDAGSAITVDVVKDKIFMGGFIYPGLNAMSKTYKDISLALEYDFNFDVDLNKLPKNSQDAISYGYLKTLFSEVMSHKLPIFLTGGHAKFFKNIFVNACVDEGLIFKGMQKIISKI